MGCSTGERCRHGTSAKASATNCVAKTTTKTYTNCAASQLGSTRIGSPTSPTSFGFDHNLIEQYYAKLEQLEEKKAVTETVKAELGGSVDELSKIAGILLLKQNDAEKKQQLLDAFDFRQQDKDQTEQLVEGIDARIAELNSRRYSLNHARRKIVASLEEDQILF